MTNEKFIPVLSTYLTDRLNIINRKLEYLNRESKKKYALNDPDVLQKIKQEYETYNTEFDLLTQLSDFYSENV